MQEQLTNFLKWIRDNNCDPIMLTGDHWPDETAPPAQDWEIERLVEQYISEVIK